MKVGGGQNQEDLKPPSLYLIVHGAGSSEVAPLAPEMRGTSGSTLALKKGGSRF